MARWREQTWEARELGLSRRDRRSGVYRSYTPDPLVARPLVVDAVLAARIDTAERAVRGLAGRDGASSMAGMSRFLLRSEAIASSRIEGVAPSARHIAIADIDDDAARGRTNARAELVANNIAVVRTATDALARSDRVTLYDVVRLQRSLLPETHGHGLRDRQNWIGGSHFTPIGAEFVPPHPDEVPALMEDLAEYATSSPHAPLVQAALVHAQFETIHPFADGNGRVGRALIHTVLERRGLTAGAVLPVSAVLATLSHAYVAGLTAYRYDGDPHSDVAISGVATWLATFADAVTQATTIVTDMADAIAHIRADWERRVTNLRRDEGGRAPRSDSATARLLALLPEVPAVTALTVQDLLQVSAPAARKALDELVSADILAAVSIGRGSRAYLAPEVIQLLDLTERRIASTRFDTRASEPSRSVPALPTSE